jgi:hypothetical protein
MIHGHNNGFSGCTIDNSLHTDSLTYDGHVFFSFLPLAVLKRKKATLVLSCAASLKTKKAAKDLFGLLQLFRFIFNFLYQILKRTTDRVSIIIPKVKKISVCCCAFH